MVEIIPVSTTLELQAADESHVPALHQLVLKNKAWLQQSLDWPQYVTSQEETRKHVQGNMLLHQRGYAKMYLIFCQNEMAGVLSFNAIEPINKAAYIGYWLDESLQGRCLLYTSPRIRGFVISAKLLSVVACGYAFHSVIPFMPGSDFLNFFFTR